MANSTPDVEHGVESCVMNNLGGGWQIICLCGWGSSCNVRMQDTGEQFDTHLFDEAEAVPRPATSPAPAPPQDAPEEGAQS